MSDQQQLYKVNIYTATTEHIFYAQEICRIIEEAAKIRGTGIAKRNPEYIREKILQGKAVIALTDEGAFAGFCYIESWGRKKDFIANSGLIVAPQFRNLGLGKRIKDAVFHLSRQKFPQAKLFGITTSPAVMKINYMLGYRPVTFDQLTDDEDFWAGCQSCVNFDILQRTNYRHCLCTAMLYDPAEKKERKKKENHHEKSSVSL